MAMAAIWVAGHLKGHTPFDFVVGCNGFNERQRTIDGNLGNAATRQAGRPLFRLSSWRRVYVERASLSRRRDHHERRRADHEIRI
jgi:hypothetical protein